MLLELEYPDLVSKLALLLGAGMTLQGAFRKIAGAYGQKRTQNKTAEMPAYEEMLVACRQMESGVGEQRADCRKWTGWSAAEGSDEDQWVYVTQTGTAYHREYSCTHLELSIRSVAEAEIAALRNENGEAYRKCMQCRYAENAFGRLYITNQGDCYHKDLGCSGIKRTVRMIRLSEVGTRRPCSRCGQ